MARLGKKQKKKLAFIGAVAGVVAASLRRREVVNVTSAPSVGPTRLSLAEWKSVLNSTRKSLSKKNLPTLAAGVAYYATLAFFPMLAAAVAISALLITPEQLDGLISSTEEYLPANISSVINTQLQNLVSQRSGNFLVASLAVLVALFGASGASKNLVIASNVAYGVKESRGWLAQQLWGILWTVAGIIFGFIFLALLAVNGSILGYFGLSDQLISWVLYGRWPLIILVTILGLSVFYRYGPNRPQVRWQWVSWGAAIATLVWMVATSLFFVYVQNFANYNQSYSLFAGIIVLMIWMNLSALIALLGAEINHQLETIGHKKWRGVLGSERD